MVSIVCFAFHSSQTCAFVTLLICGRVERWINWCNVKTEIVTLNKVSHSWFDFASLWYYWTWIFILHMDLESLCLGPWKTLLDFWLEQMWDHRFTCKLPGICTLWATRIHEQIIYFHLYRSSFTLKNIIYLFGYTRA